MQIKKTSTRTVVSSDLNRNTGMANNFLNISEAWSLKYGAKSLQIIHGFVANMQRESYIRVNVSYFQLLVASLKAENSPKLGELWGT